MVYNYCFNFIVIIWMENFNFFTNRVLLLNFFSYWIISFSSITFWLFGKSLNFQ